MQSKAFLQDTIEILTRELTIALQTNSEVTDANKILVADNEAVTAERNYLHNQIDLMNEEAEALEVENRLLIQARSINTYNNQCAAETSDQCAPVTVEPDPVEEDEEDAYLLSQCVGVALGTVMRILEESAAEVTLTTGEDFLGMQVLLAQAEELRDVLDNSVYWDGYPTDRQVSNLYDIIYPT